MTTNDLEAWRSRMGWSVRKACLALEISQDRWRRMVQGGRIPTHIALACLMLELLKPEHGLVATRAS